MKIYAKPNKFDIRNFLFLYIYVDLVKRANIFTVIHIMNKMYGRMGTPGLTPIYFLPYVLKMQHQPHHRILFPHSVVLHYCA